MADEQQDEQQEDQPSYDPEIGEMLFAWEFEEYKQGHRSKKWYIIAGLLAAFLLFYSVFSQNFTFALLILLFVFIYFLLEWRAPGKIPFVISDLGVGVGNRFYRYTDVDSFWIIYDPPVFKNIYFRLKGAMSPRLTIPLENVDPVQVRGTLMAFIHEDLEQEDIPFSESIGRILKL